MKRHRYTDKVLLPSVRDSGNRGEQLVVDYLKVRGYKVLEQNWRRVDCEIDIVASKKKQLYFIEVKYRQFDLETAISSLSTIKLRQMAYSASRYCQETGFDGSYQLMFVAVAGTTTYEYKIFMELA